MRAALPVDGSPVQFIFPGEPGFFSTEPIFDCDALMSDGSEVDDSVRAGCACIGEAMTLDGHCLCGAVTIRVGGRA